MAHSESHDTRDVVPRARPDSIDALIDAVSAGSQPTPPPAERHAPSRPAGAGARSWRARQPWSVATAVRVTGASLVAFALGVAATFWALRVMEPRPPRIQVSQRSPEPRPPADTPRAPAAVATPPQRALLPATAWPFASRATPPAFASRPPRIEPIAPAREPQPRDATARDTSPRAGAVLTVRAPQPARLAMQVKPPVPESAAPGRLDVAPVLTTAGLPSLPTVAATPMPIALNVRGVAEDAVRKTLSRYEAAYDQLDASAAAAVWPSVDRSALGNAFGALRSQNLAFDGCDLQVQTTTATARCWGTAEYVPRVGRSEPRRGHYTWTFNMRRAGTDWQIERVVSSPVNYR